MLRPQDSSTREKKRLDGLWSFRLDPDPAAGVTALAPGASDGP
jgi:hypothetical protein